MLKFADKFAYINHDIDDAIRGGVLREEQLPKELIEILGSRHSERINTMISDTVTNSLAKNDVVMSKEIGDAMLALRAFMFDTVYDNPVKRNEERKATYIIEEMFDHFVKTRTRSLTNTAALSEHMRQTASYVTILPG